MKSIKALLLLMVLTLLNTSLVHAQINLVPNGSFEEYDTCPQMLVLDNLSGNCHNWNSFRGTCDYFNNCSYAYAYGSPFGYQPPRTGEAYAGFLSYYPLPVQEQLGAELLSPLEIGVRYYVSFYVSCAYDSVYMTNIATNKIGVNFTTYSYNDPTATTTPLPNGCLLYTNEIITDTLNWVKISGSFVADSVYRYIIIGCFFDKIQVDTIHLPYSHLHYHQAYYYIDDVCVSTNPLLCSVDIDDCIFELPSVFSPNGDNINDEYKWVQHCSSVDGFVMRIYNRWGQMVFSTNDYNISWDGNYNGKPQPTDVYAVYVSVFSNNKQINKSINITLLR